jgi:hypothetical protein
MMTSLNVMLIDILITINIIMLGTSEVIEEPLTSATTTTSTDITINLLKYFCAPTQLCPTALEAFFSYYFHLNNRTTIGLKQNECPPCPQWNCSRSPFLQEGECNRSGCPPCPSCFIWLDGYLEPSSNPDIIIPKIIKEPQTATTATSPTINFPIFCETIMCPIELCPQSIQNECPPCPQVKCSNSWQREVKCIRPCFHKECPPCPLCIEVKRPLIIGGSPIPDFINTVKRPTLVKCPTGQTKDRNGICRGPVM